VTPVELSALCASVFIFVLGAIVATGYLVVAIANWLSSPAPRRPRARVRGGRRPAPVPGRRRT